LDFENGEAGIAGGKGEMTTIGRPSEAGSGCGQGFEENGEHVGCGMPEEEAGIASGAGEERAAGLPSESADGGDVAFEGKRAGVFAGGAGDFPAGDDATTGTSEVVAVGFPSEVVDFSGEAAEAEAGHGLGVDDGGGGVVVSDSEAPSARAPADGEDGTGVVDVDGVWIFGGEPHLDAAAVGGDEEIHEGVPIEVEHGAVGGPMPERGEVFVEEVDGSVACGGESAGCGKGGGRPAELLNKAIADAGRSNGRGGGGVEQAETA
jgi:hypothetical protein